VIFILGIVGVIADGNLGEVVYATNLFWLDVNDLQRGSDEKIAGQERTPATGRFLSRNAIHDERGAIADRIA
jgi:hypothetical protein